MDGISRCQQEEEGANIRDEINKNIKDRPTPSIPRYLFICSRFSSSFSPTSSQMISPRGTIGDRETGRRSSQRQF